MKYLTLPMWLIVFIVGLPQLSETVYTPSLPDIANTLAVSEQLVENTLTVYLFGFAIGTLFWGQMSDRIGRKPCVFLGTIVFCIGCIGCYFSNDIFSLLLARFVQAIGGSIGSVVGQSICRDSFKGNELGRVYSIVGSSLALFPAAGPVIGGLIAQYFSWRINFIFLFGAASVMLYCAVKYLPETHDIKYCKNIDVLSTAKQLFSDQQVLLFGLIVAICNGISFSYFADGSFLLIQNLGLSSSEYGATFIPIGLSAMLGGLLSKKLNSNSNVKPLDIMLQGIVYIILGAAFITAVVLLNYMGVIDTKIILISAVILAQMVIMFGFSMAISNALALSLEKYQWCIGVASSFFGFYYYILIALITLVMAKLHNGSLLPMPIYFLSLGIIMYCGFRKILILKQ